MATTQDCFRLALEETPRYEGAVSTTPYRISTVKRFFPIQTVRIAPAPSFLDRSDELRGYEGGPPQLIDAFAPTGSLAMRAYLNDLIFLLELAGWEGEHTTGDGIITDPDSATIPAGAERWVFTKRGGIQAQTAELDLCYADEGVFLKGQGFGISNLTLNGEGALGADLLGLVVLNGDDPNLTPSYDLASIPPIRRGDLTVTWLTSSGTTQDFSIAISNPLVARKTYSTPDPTNFPDAMENGDERVRITGSIPKSALADADIDALMAGTTFSSKVRWKTPKVIGATSYPYTCWIEMPKCQYTSGEPDELANRRRFGGSFDFWAAWDESAGYDAKITIVNSITTLKTFT